MPHLDASISSRVRACAAPIALSEWVNQNQFGMHFGKRLRFGLVHAIRISETLFILKDRIVRPRLKLSLYRIRDIVTASLFQLLAPGVVNGANIPNIGATSTRIRAWGQCGTSLILKLDWGSPVGGWLLRIRRGRSFFAGTSIGRAGGILRLQCKQHFLYFLPLPHGHGSLRPTRGSLRRTGAALRGMNSSRLDSQ